MTAYGLAIDPGWLGRDPSDALTRCCAEIVADDALMLEAWNDWQETHEPELLEALRDMEIGEMARIDEFRERALESAARKRMELLAGEARKAA